MQKAPLMKFIVIAEDKLYEYLQSCAPASEWLRVADSKAFYEHPDADAFFNLIENKQYPDYKNIMQPVFINSVVTPLSEMNVPQNIIRINAWEGFLEKETWEAAGIISRAAEKVCSHLGKKMNAVNDIPGFITARVIAMIINEAFFAKGENVSTEQEIDVAMKLGTNYPYGPFEWGNIVGLKNVYALLKKLSLTDDRYKVASALEMKINLS